jgi:uncharacterized sulfatase
VVVILADDLNWVDVDTIPTPAIDKLLSRGASWRRHYSMPVCSPTRYEIMFGRYGRREGFLELICSELCQPTTPTPSPANHSLGDLFKAEGYETSYFGKWHAGSLHFAQDGLGDPSRSAMYRGFSSWTAGSWSNLRQGGGTGYYDWLRVDEGTEEMTGQYADEALVEAVEASYADTSGDPAFRFISFRLPHGPLEAPPAYTLPPGTPPALGSRETFEHMVQALDFYLERLIDFGPGDTGCIDLETTLLVFLSDNGTPPNASGPNQSAQKVKTTTFEGGVNVPLIAVGPGILPGSNITHLVQATDLYATFAGVLGVDPPGGEDSISIFTNDRTYAMAELVKDGKDDVSVIQGWYKLMTINGVETLYDLFLDGKEESPLDLTDPVNALILQDLRHVRDVELPPRQ